MFSRKQVIQTKLLDLNEVLHNLENMLSRMVGEDVSLEMRYDREIPCIEADIGMVEQIIMNLAVNSRDAMPKGGKLSVATRSVAVNEAYARQNTEARPGQFVCLSVTDTGCGIDPKALQKIFEPFFSTKEVGKGTGLGLATVYGIVKQHRGWIEVESEVGKGTTFKIFLPGTAQTKVSAPESVSKPSKPEAVRGGNEKILIVEDETGLREIVHQILQQYQLSGGRGCLRRRSLERLGRIPRRLRLAINRHDYAGWHDGTGVGGRIEEAQTRSQDYLQQRLQPRPDWKKSRPGKGDRRFEAVSSVPTSARGP